MYNQKPDFIRLDTIKLFTTLCSDLDIHSSIVSYCVRRLKNEGITFLTKTLPKLGELVLAAIEVNSLSSMKDVTEINSLGQTVPKYSAFQWKSGAPLHFKRLTDLIFDVNGRVRVDACEVAIYQIRQMSQYLYKLALDFTDDQLVAAESSFIKVEEELSGAQYDIQFVDKIRKNIESAYPFPKLEYVLHNSRPRFGPGSFADQSIDKTTKWYHKKYSVDHFNACVAKYEAISGYFRAFPSAHDPIGKLPTDTSDYSEVLFVPKDSRGPRTIMREPLHALSLQMSFFDWFSDFLEKETKGRVNFTDQTVNRRLAEQGSRDGSWATIDLKEASDRVSYAVVKQLARNIPVLNWFLKNSRTSQAKLPSGKIMNLNKLAGMGSGLTFVWLSFLIHAAVATEISVSNGLSYRAASTHVYTYGDDLIVPTCYVTEAKRALRKVSLVINDKKSYTSRHLNITRCFRESCGGDYYGGADVNIIRLKLQNCSLKVSKNLLTVHGSQAVVMISAHAGEAQLNGLNALAEFFYKELEVCTGKLPLVGLPTSVIGRLTRKYVSYPVDKTGTYVPLRVICAMPVLLDSPTQHPLYRYAEALSAQGTDAFAWMGGRKSVLKQTAVELVGSNNAAEEQYTVALPRTVKYSYKTISSLSVMR